MEEQLAPVLDHLDRADPGEIVGVYLYGSATSGGLRPDSDLDVLVLTRRSLTPGERMALTHVLLDASSGSSHPLEFSDGAAGRPLELTCVVVDEHRRWPDPAAHDFQYGEWLRADIQVGQTPQTTLDPDVPILLATAHTAHRVLRGHPLDEVVDPVAPGELREAMLASIDDILGEIVGDERNTLLAFARIVTTLRTGEIVPKDVAAAAVAETLAPGDRTLLERARSGYLGEADDDWTGLAEEVTGLSHALAAQARALAAAPPV